MKKALSLLLITGMLLAIPSVSAYDGTSPSVEAFAKHTVGAAPIFFSQDDFTSRVSGNERLEGIIVTSLPVNGILRFDGHTMLAGEAVTTNSLDKLHFIPCDSGSVSDYFSFIPVFRSGVAMTSVDVGLNVLEQPNRPPHADDVFVQTYRNIAINGKFNAADPDGDPLSYRITGKAKRGEIKIEADGTFTYTPYQNKTGTDTITYVAVDPYGSTSEPAKITVRITKPGTKITYADMDGHPAHFSALQMAGKNLLVGETVGGKHYFRPDAPVSRGEFLALLVNALDLGKLQDGMQTGFADDDDIPAWMRPYVTFGLNASIVQGKETRDGQRVFAANAPITRNQASVMVNKSLQIANSGMVSVFITNKETPSWAVQSVANLRSVGLLDAAEMFFLDEPMTRADVVVMVHNAVTLKEQQNEKRSGLLSWVFG
jgi:hypothetical protein